MSERLIQWITWPVRLIAGAVFIFSGFTKGIDPWGTIYKINDYLSAWHIDLWPNIVLTAAFMLIAVEFCLGIFIFTGCFRRSAPILSLLVMLFMLPLTLWIAITDPVQDCGCFGDALIISNWATFWKNVVLTAMIVWLLIYNRRITAMVTPALQWLAVVASGAYIIIIAFTGYNYQPLLDFRPYKIGEKLLENESEPDDSKSIKFIYSKDGVEKSFGIDDELPDESDGWTFARREESANGKGNTADHKNLTIWSEDGEENMTHDVIDETGKQLILFMPDIKNVSIATTWKINSLNTWADDNDIDIFAIVNGTPAEVDYWKDLSMPSYPIYTAEDTTIKEIARGNPAIIYLQDGVIRWKSTLAALNVDDFMDSRTSSDPMAFAVDNTLLLKKISYTYISVMAVLVLLSLLPDIKNTFFSRKPSRKKEKEKSLKASTHDDKAHPGE